MSVASVGNGGGSLETGLNAPEMYSRAAARAQVQAARQRAEAASRLAASIPGNGSGESKHQVLFEVAADLEQVSLAFNKKLQFVVDHRSNEVTVKVIDKETDKVIKELPPEELQRLHRKLRETIGFLFDERV
jgi:flagellar protein FlaG